MTALSRNSNSVRERLLSRSNYTNTDHCTAHSSRQTQGMSQQREQSSIAHATEAAVSTVIEADSTAATSGSKLHARRVPVSCSKAFDSLYFCYSPFHQGKIYYQSGELDDCRGRLKRFRMCAMSRFRSSADSEVTLRHRMLHFSNCRALSKVA
jgi:Protein of unknown function (DUF3128)